ncbi:MAG: hypothetical protein M3Q58_17290 [Bacteroidota bacterium]|nr:hypothetical protein [Bacteroidota bacterium]
MKIEYSEKEQALLKQAKQLFDQKKYAEASARYTELEKMLEMDGINSYYLGMSLFHTQSNKLHCLNLLETAAFSSNVPEDVFYFLGKANQYCYRFKKAIKSFEKYMSIAKVDENEKQRIQKEIELCNNGIKFINTPRVVEVVEKKWIEKDYVHLAFTNLASGAKMLVVPDYIKSETDKKKGFKSIMFLSAEKNVILFSSYDEDDSNGKNIYKINKLPSGNWGTPKKIEAIGSNLDEDYPYLALDGETLFFSSKGFDSMGGYDIFKSI